MADEARPDGSEELVDLDGMRQVARECDWTLRELTEMYADKTLEEIERLQEAVEGGQDSEVTRLAHGCAGASAMSCVVGMVPLFRGIEEAGRNGRMTEAAELLDQARQRFRQIRDALEHAASTE